MLAVRSCLRFGATTCVARPSLSVSAPRRGFRGRDFLDEIHIWRDKVIKLANPSIGVTKGDIDPWNASVSERDEPDRGENRPEPVVEALKAGSLGFGFSAGGMLFPYYIGVVEALEEMGIITGKKCFHCSKYSSSSYADLPVASVSSSAMFAKQHSVVLCQECITRGPVLSVYRGHKDRRSFCRIADSSDVSQRHRFQSSN